MVAVLQNFGKEGWLNFIGGCCGTTPAHIEAMAQLAKTLKPHVPQPVHASTLSGIEPFEVTDEKRPVLVGERTNVIGSRKFKDLIVAGKQRAVEDFRVPPVERGLHGRRCDDDAGIKRRDDGLLGLLAQGRAGEGEREQDEFQGASVLRILET
jgi:hypothetical protein